MWKHCNYNGMDQHSRYLNVSLYMDTSCFTRRSAEVCRGRFGRYLKERLKIQRIPYDLSIADMIVERMLIPDLFVWLPSEYFTSWSNFPSTGHCETPEDLIPASYHSVSIINQGDWSLESLLHPYDKKDLKKDFVDRFSEEAPRILKEKKHPNGFYFRPYEAYFSYWKGYILVEALSGYEDIEKFLSWEAGQSVLISRFIDVSQKWEENYKDTFTRLSFYRTAKTTLALWENPHPAKTYKEVSEFIQKATKFSPELLEQDIEKLLILFKDWMKQLKEGRRYYPQAIELLRQDIYFLLEWLCNLTGTSEEVYFEKWSYRVTWDMQPWVQLKEVISYEEFELKRRFITYIPGSYAKILEEAGYLTDIEKIYARLSEYESFWPWIRAFSDLHDQLEHTSTTKPIVFRQPRVLDHLLVFAIRTEILIREFFRKATHSEKKDLRKVFSCFSEMLSENSEHRKILCEIYGRWNKTKLIEKPDDIFEKINCISQPKKWSKFQHHILLSVLRFVTARNYFAHHSFKDITLNSPIVELTAQIFESCLESVIYMDSIMQEILLRPDSGDNQAS